ncbi:hypothetical protein MRX96_027688 [Rhipicephalus microplus]
MVAASHRPRFLNASGQRRLPSPATENLLPLHHPPSEEVSLRLVGSLAACPSQRKRRETHVRIVRTPHEDALPRKAADDGTAAIGSRVTLAT